MKSLKYIIILILFLSGCKNEIIIKDYIKKLQTSELMELIINGDIELNRMRGAHSVRINYRGHELGEVNYAVVLQNYDRLDTVVRDVMGYHIDGCRIARCIFPRNKKNITSISQDSIQKIIKRVQNIVKQSNNNYIYAFNKKEKYIDFVLNHNLIKVDYDNYFYDMVYCGTYFIAPIGRYMCLRYYYGEQLNPTFKNHNPTNIEISFIHKINSNWYFYIRKRWPDEH